MPAARAMPSRKLLSFGIIRLRILTPARRKDDRGKLDRLLRVLPGRRNVGVVHGDQRCHVYSSEAPTYEMPENCEISGYGSRTPALTSGRALC